MACFLMADFFQIGWKEGKSFMVIFFSSHPKPLTCTA